MPRLDASDMMILRFISMQGTVNLFDFTRSERMVVWSLAERGLVKSDLAFYTVTTAGIEQLIGSPVGSRSLTQTGVLA